MSLLCRDISSEGPHLKIRTVTEELQRGSKITTHMGTLRAVLVRLAVFSACETCFFEKFGFQLGYPMIIMLQLSPTKDISPLPIFM